MKFLRKVLFSLFIFLFFDCFFVSAKEIELSFYVNGGKVTTPGFFVNEIGDFLVYDPDCFYASYKDKDIIYPINRLKNVSFSLKKDGTQLVKDREWYYKDYYNNKVYFFSESKKYSIDSITSSMGENYSTLDLYAHWENAKITNGVDVRSISDTNPTSMKIVSKTKSVTVGGTLDLSVQFSPTNSTSESVKWSSSNTKIATVSSSGKVKGIKEGKVTINALSKSGLKSSITLTVTKKKTTKHYVIIQYHVNGGTLEKKHADKVSLSKGYVYVNGKVFQKKMTSKGSLTQNGLINYNNTYGLNVVRNGYSIDKTKVWNTKANGTGKSYNQTTQYKASDFFDSSQCDISKKDCVVTLYLNWKKSSLQNNQQHYVNIIYDMNGGKLDSEHGSTISSSGSTLICKKNKVCSKIIYNGQLGKNGLRNYNNKKYINIYKEGYNFTGWNTKKDGSGKTYNQSKIYKASEFCDASKNDCVVTLYAKWEKKLIKPVIKENYIYKKADYDVNVWYAIIPKKYKMHYAYGQDKVLGKEFATEMAKRYGATLVIDTEFLGIPMKNGKLMKEGDSVKGYDFTIEYNEKHKYNYEIFNVFLTDSGKGHISFKDINLGFDYGGNGLHYHPYDTKDPKTGEEKKGEMYMAIYEQIVMNGVEREYSDKDDYIGKKSRARTWLAYDYEGNQYVGVSKEVTKHPIDEDDPFEGITAKEEVIITNNIIAENIKEGNLSVGTSIKTLYNLDGGGSAAFIYKGERKNPYSPSTMYKERPIYGIFYWNW